jgi:hypothetical protein
MSLKDYHWNNLLNALYQKKCTPFIGAGASAQWLPLASDLSKGWAEKYDYPLEDVSDLSRVAQFLELEYDDPLFPKNLLSEAIRKIEPPHFSLDENRNTPHALLADLNLPVYITTNYDHFMEKALVSRGKEPVSEFCRWNNYAIGTGIPSVFDNHSTYTPTAATPLVYHLHGDFNIPPSMVLTESDYIDFLVKLNKDTTILPSTIQHTFASTLIFIGYSLLDINFRIIFRGITNFIGNRFRSSNIAVMRPPKNPIHPLEKMQRYLDRYTKEMFNVNVFWGDVTIFSSELRQQWDIFKKQQYRNN